MQPSSLFTRIVRLAFFHNEIKWPHMGIVTFNIYIIVQTQFYAKEPKITCFEFKSEFCASHIR